MNHHDENEQSRRPLHQEIGMIILVVVLTFTAVPLVLLIEKLWRISHKEDSEKRRRTPCAPSS
jgi:hypothetical protein